LEFGGFGMSLYIKLNEDLNPKELIYKISKEISNYEGEDLPNSFLCIEVKSAKEVVDILAKYKTKELLLEGNIDENI
jgi:hypothetical protein